MIDAVAIADHLPADLGIDAVQELLEAASTVSQDLAASLAQGMGGSDALLARLQCERPWIRNAHLDRDERGRTTADADYAFVAESVQDRPHDEVVNLSRTLLALAPEADVVRCAAIDATGEPAGIEHPIAQKAIERQSLPSDARVAWNRARVRAATAAVAAATTTEHLAMARGVVTRAAALISAAGDAWVAGRSVDDELIRQATELAELDGALRPPPVAAESAGPLDLGDLPDLVAVSHVATMVSRNLVLALFRGDDVAPLAAELSKSARKLNDLKYWGLLADPPIAETQALCQGLDDVAVVSAERGCGTAFDISLQHSRVVTLARAARMARRRADRRLAMEAELLRATLQDAGFDATIARREPHEMLALVHVPGIDSWLEHFQDLAARSRDVIPEERSFWMAPVVEGGVVGSHAVRVIVSVFPDAATVASWPELPLPLVDERLGDLFRTALAAVQEASGIVSSWPGHTPHEVEHEAYDAAVDRFGAALEQIKELATETADELAANVRDAVVELGEMLEAELADAAPAEPREPTIAELLIFATRGEPVQLMADCVAIAAACAEWDAARA